MTLQAGRLTIPGYVVRTIRGQDFIADADALPWQFHPAPERLPHAY